MITKQQLREQLQKAIKQLDSMEEVKELYYNVDEGGYTEARETKSIEINFEQWDEGEIVFNLSVW